MLQPKLVFFPMIFCSFLRMDDVFLYITHSYNVPCSHDNTFSNCKTLMENNNFFRLRKQKKKEKEKREQVNSFVDLSILKGKEWDIFRIYFI